MQWILLIAALVLMGFLPGCSSTTLEGGAAIETSLVQRQEIGSALEQRLMKSGQSAPVFGTKRRPSTEHLVVMTKFANTLPSGLFIIGGRPNYWIEVSRKELGQPGDMTRFVEFSVRLIASNTNETVAESAHYGKCIASEATFTNFTRCSILEPLILQRALEKL